MRPGALFFLLSAVAFAQPRLQSAKLESRAASGNLEAAVKSLAAQQGPLWIGWAVPAVPNRLESCWGGHWLEGRGVRAQSSGPVMLEGPSTAHILLRVENGQTGKIRSFGSDCELDAGGLRFVWLTGVQPGESVAYLSRVLRDESSRKLRENAMHVLTTHAEPAAMKPLFETARNDRDPHVRGQALFWIAQRAGKDAISAIQHAMDNDPETKVKERAVFALSQLPKSEGVPLLIDVAKNHKNHEIRRKAMFWLGQSKDPRAIDFFESILK